jgi:hypothetical protein
MPEITQVLAVFKNMHVVTMQWPTTKDTDAIRKIHLTVRDLPVWSFDKTTKEVFGLQNSY